MRVGRPITFLSQLPSVWSFCSGGRTGCRASCGPPSAPSVSFPFISHLVPRKPVFYPGTASPCPWTLTAATSVKHCHVSSGRPVRLVSVRSVNGAPAPLCSAPPLCLGPWRKTCLLPWPTALPSHGLRNCVHLFSTCAEPS